jgi:hypothetical protein
VTGPRGLQDVGGRAPGGEWATPTAGAVGQTEPNRPVQSGFGPPLADIGIAASPPGLEGTEPR